MTWKCRVCDSENEDEDEVCVNCGCYRREPAYDIEDNLEDEENAE